MKISHRWLKEFINLDDSHTPQKISDILTDLGIEVEHIDSTSVTNDVIYDISVTPNRADCVSHLGIARELSARTSLKVAKRTDTTIPHQPGNLAVNVLDSMGCPRYMLRHITQVNNGESPQWLKDKLASVGIQSHNIVVDVTNYVLMECGQPLHAFDASKIVGNTIIIKRAENGEKFTTLDSKARILSSDDIVICDLEKTLAIAGVMGGENSEVDNESTDIIIESAYFNPSSIRKTSKRLGLQTDASYRFERGVDIDNVRYALDLATKLISDLTCGVPKERIDQYPVEFPIKNIDVRYSKVCSLVGVTISNEDQRDYMKSIGCGIFEIDDKTYNVTIPSWRVDMAFECDVAEEIARLLGYDNIPAVTYAKVSLLGAQLPSHLGVPKYRAGIKSFMVANGFNECCTAVQTSPDIAKLNDEPVVVLKNPLGLENSQFRTSVIPSLCAVAGLNMRNGRDSIKLFECGKTFRRSENQQANGFSIIEREHIAVLMTGKHEDHWDSKKSKNMDFYDISGIAEAMLKSCSITAEFKAVDNAEDTSLFTQNRLDIMCGNQRIGAIGEVLPSVAALFNIDKPVYAFEMDMRSMGSKNKTFSHIGVYPTVRRDIAFVVDESVMVGDLISAINQQDIGILRTVEVFDVYRDKSLGDDKKSIGIALTFRSDDRTLVDTDVDSVMQNIISSALSSTGAFVRGV